MKCSNCGNYNSNDSMFCIECGSPLGTNNNNNVRYNITNELNKMYNYFSKKSDTYDEVLRTNSYINCTPAKYKVWLILICAYVLSSSLPVFLSIPEIMQNFLETTIEVPTLILSLIIIIICAVVLVSHIRSVRKKRKNIEFAKIRFAEAGRELYEYYVAYGNCPVNFENTRPEVLYKLCEIAQNGRAYTINDAVRVYYEDCYRLGMNNSPNDLVLNSVFNMHNH